MGAPKSNDLRELALSHFKKNKTVTEIYQILDKKASKRTIQRWIKDFKLVGKITFSKSTGRPRTVSTRTKKNQVKRLLKNNSGRAASRYSQISQTSVVRICKELGLNVRKFST